MNIEYDWDEEFAKLNNTITKEKPTNLTHWKTADGSLIKYVDMSNKHLINALRVVYFQILRNDDFDLNFHKVTANQLIEEMKRREILIN